MKVSTTSTSTEATPTDGGGGKVSRSLTIDDFNRLTLQLSDPLENFELLILQRNKRLSCIIQHGRFPFNQNVEFELSATSNSEWNSTLKNFQKQDNLEWYTQIFENVLQKVFFPFNFAPGIFRTFG